MQIINLVLFLITLGLGYYIKFNAYKKNNKFYHFLANMIFLFATMMLGAIYVDYTHSYNLRLYVDLLKLYTPAITEFILSLCMFYILTKFCSFIAFYGFQFIILRIQSTEVESKKEKD